MYDEVEYIYQEFQKHFIGKQKEPIILYGIGKNTRELLPRISEYNIEGLMDGNRKEGTVYGRPILDYEDVLRLNVKTIVIIARPAVISVIYHRISEFCLENSITVYDIHGQDLTEIYVNQENDIPYFHLSSKDLKEEIEKHDIISFDVFDTLIMRKVLYPTDIFSIMEKRLDLEEKGGPLPFAALRIEAEKQLYDENVNPNIKEIYDRIQELCGIDKKCKERLLALEIRTEMEFLIPRKKMLDLYNGIKDRKKVYLISDMYLPQEIISKMLKKCGYEGYEKLLVSCEQRKTKSEGLFGQFIHEMRKAGYDKQDCLHIGDNYVADIMSAKDVGMDAFQIMSARELLESSSYGKLLAENLGFMDRLAAGMLCGRMFQDPFVLYGTKGKLKIENLQDFAYTLLAPMIFYFTLWLIQQIYKFNCDYVLYPSRDAYFIEKLCKKICEKQDIDSFPKGEYFYTSRRAVMAATVWNEDDIAHVAGPDFWGSISQLFDKRFNVTVDQLADSIKAEDREILERYLERYRQDILRQSEKERNNYIGYISRTGMRDHRKIAFIDFVAAGKVQNGLEKLIPEKDIQGFYFLRREPNKGELDRKIKVESFFPSKGAFEIDLNVYKYYLFLEMILTSPEATFHSIADDGGICFMEETRTEEHRKIVNGLQKSILEYVEEFSALCPCLLSCHVNWKVPDFILGFLDKEYTTLVMENVTSMVLTDEFLGQTFNIFQT